MRISTALLCTAILSVPAMAATIHVQEDYDTIQAALLAAQAGDTVLVECGTYYEHDIEMPSGVTLMSETGDPACATIDAQQLGRVLHCEFLSSGTRIEGFTITGGYLDDGNDGNGGGVHADGSIVISNVVITGNYANRSGGGACLRRDVVLENSVVSDNHTLDPGSLGGGLACEFDVSIQYSVISENSAEGIGGGLALYNGESSILNTVIMSNTAGNKGGGVYCDNGFSQWNRWIHFENVALISNAASLEGGGLWIYSNGDIRHATIVGNSADSGGGVFEFCYYSDPMAPWISKSIIAFNTQGGGISSDIIWHTISCCDVYGNEGGNYTGVWPDQTGEYGNISVDPEFCGIPGSGNYYLQSDSPCAPGNHPDGYDCDLLGTFPVNCEGTSSMKTSWSVVKSLY